MRNPEIRKIIYKGITTSPDDYMCPDGDLAGAMGVENLNGAITSASRYQPKKIMLLETKSGEEAYVVYLHQEPTYTNAIIAYNTYAGTQWYWIDVTSGFPGIFNPESISDNNRLGVPTSFMSVKDVCSIGNTLIIFGDEIEYLIFSLKDNKYSYLGTHIPELPITFGLKASLQRYIKDGWVDGNNTGEEIAPKPAYTGFAYFGFGGFPEDFDGISLSEKNIEYASPFIRATVNELVNKVHDKGFFCMPFLVRYAYKLYDGSTTMHSAPVLMPVYTFDGEVNGISVVSDYSTNLKMLSYYITYVKAVMDYAVDAAALVELKKWKDIVKGVEIYISRPLYTYNQDGNVRANVLGDQSSDSPVFYDDYLSKVYTISDNEPAGETGLYRKRCISSLVPSDFWDHYGKPKASIQLDLKGKNEWLDEVKHCSQFYLFKSYDIDELSTARTVIPCSSNYINNIVTRTAAIDEYQSHDTLMAESIFLFNKRVNLGGIRRRLYSNFSIKTLVPYQNQGTDRRGLADNSRSNVCLYTTINEGGLTNVVQGKTVEMPTYFWWQYIYHPNVDTANIYIVSDTPFYNINLKAEEHTGLNGAVSILSNLSNHASYGLDISYTTPTPTATEVSTPAKLYTSNVGNPWVFEPTNVNTIGTGKILATASAAKALTDMQFSGEHLYSIYVFTTEGIWGSKPSGTGGWQGFEPVARDVLTHPLAVCQIDDAVVFPSDKGIMLLQGSATVELSATLEEKSRVKVSEMTGLRRLLLNPALTDLANLFLINRKAEDVENYELDEVFSPDPRAYFDSDELRIFFDYTNSRLVFSRNDKQYSIVYSLSTKLWSMTPWHLVYKIRSYPDSYAMYKTLGDKWFLVNLSNRNVDIKGDETDGLYIPQNGFVITRPIKCEGYGDTLKELEVLTHQGRFGRTKVKVIVYGTLDYKKWYPVASSVNSDIYRSHGQYYRAFAIALMLDLSTDDYLDSATLQIEPRRTNKLHGMGYR